MALYTNVDNTVCSGLGTEVICICVSDKFGHLTVVFLTNLVQQKQGNR